jgi:hypothetical protein
VSVSILGVLHHEYRLEKIPARFSDNSLTSSDRLIADDNQIECYDALGDGVVPS